MPTYSRQKAFGQNFLKDRAVARKIVDRAVEIASASGCRKIIEIGPGKGALTEPLLEKSDGYYRLVLVEKDRKMAAEWNQRVDSSTGLRVVSGDFLDFSQEELLGGEPSVVMSNLPYSSGTPIVLALSRWTGKVRGMVLMFQKEVAARIAAGPSSSERGALSLLIQNEWDTERWLSVKPGSFSPPPKVQSEVLVLTPRSRPWIAEASTEAGRARWNSLLRLCFSQRRKQLQTLAKAHFQLKMALSQSGVDGSLRAEALDWVQWLELFLAFSSPSSG